MREMKIEFMEKRKSKQRDNLISRELFLCRTTWPGVGKKSNARES